MQYIVKSLLAFLDKVVLPVVARQMVVQTVQKTVKFPFAFLDLVLCPSLCNNRCRMVETVQKTVESPQLVLALGQGC